MISEKKQETINGNHSLNYYRECSQFGLIFVFAAVCYILLESPGEIYSWILLIAICAMGIKTSTWHRKIKSWEKEQGEEQTEFLKCPHCKNLFEFKFSRDKKDVFGMEDKDLFKANPSNSSTTIPTSIKTSEIIPTTAENYDFIKDNGDYENFYKILKGSLIKRLKEMHRNQNSSVGRNTDDLFSIIRECTNFLEKSGTFIDENINISIDKMKITDVLIEEGAYFTPTIYEWIEDTVLDIYEAFKCHFKEYEMSEENVFNQKEFKFVADDIFLCPYINPKTAQMYLIIKKVDLKTGKTLLEDMLFCTHTVITEITDEEFWYNDKNTVYSEKFQKSTLKIRSEGGLREIELSLEDNIFAFNSWVEGIAIAGADALRIQADIEKYANLMYPMVVWLHRFLARAHDDYIFSYLDKIERECVFEGAKHESSLIANLIPLVKTFAICPWETQWEIDCPEGYYREEEGYYFKNNIKEILTYMQEIIPLEKVVDGDKILIERFDIVLSGEFYQGKLFAKDDAQFLRDIEKQLGRPVNMWDLAFPEKKIDFDIYDGYVMIVNNFVVGIFFDYVEEYYTPDSVNGLKHLADDEIIKGF